MCSGTNCGTIKFFSRLVAWSIGTMKHLDPLNNSDGLVAWTIQEARQLSPEHRVPSEVEAEPSPRIGCWRFSRPRRSK